MKVQRLSFIASVSAGITLLINVTCAHAIDTCKVKVDKNTGVVQVDATGVGGPLLWGATMGSETNAFFNAASCVNGDKATRCQLADPATVDAKTPPEDCTLYLDDGVAACSRWIRGCTPGARDAVAGPPGPQGEPGPAGPPGPQGEPGMGGGGGGVVVQDSMATVIGVYDFNHNQPSAVRDIGGTPVKIRIQYDGTFVDDGPNTYWYYESADCSGQRLKYADTSLVKYGNVRGTTVYFTPSSTTLVDYFSLGYAQPNFTNQTDCDNWFGPGTTFVAPDECCLSEAYSIPLVEEQSEDLSVFVPPFSATMP